MTGGVSVVVPVFGNGERLNELCQAVLARLSGHNVEIILVDDGSKGDAWSIICQLSQRHPVQVRGIRLGRNFGQHAALLAGVRSATHSITVTMDDDLQQNPSDIPRLLEQLNRGTNLVYACPKVAASSAYRTHGSRIVRRFMEFGLGVENTRALSPFRAFKTNLREAFQAGIGPNVSLDTLLTWATSNVAVIEVDFSQRQVGSSTYNTLRLVSFAIDNITGYSGRPLRLTSVLGVMCFCLGMIGASWLTIQYFIDRTVVPGFTFLGFTILLFSGIQLLVLGVFGEYLARMHFRIMQKPTYFVAEVTGGVIDSGERGDIE